MCLFVCIDFCVVLGSSTDLWHWGGVSDKTRACVKPVVGQRIVTLSAYLIRTRPSGRKINSWAVCCSAFRKELLLEHNTIFTSLYIILYTPLSFSHFLWSLSLSFFFLFSISNCGWTVVYEHAALVCKLMCHISVFKVNIKSTKCVANAVSYWI